MIMSWISGRRLSLISSWLLRPSRRSWIRLISRIARSSRSCRKIRSRRLNCNDPTKRRFGLVAILTRSFYHPSKDLLQESKSKLRKLQDTLSLQPMRSFNFESLTLTCKPSSRMNAETVLKSIWMTKRKKIRKLHGLRRRGCTRSLKKLRLNLLYIPPVMTLLVTQMRRIR